VVTVVDAFTGREIEVGDPPLMDPRGRRWQLVEIEDRSFYDVVAVIRCEDAVASWAPGYPVPAMATLRVPLQVRFLHPLFFFRRVAFVTT
jgi:hypothetical protein